MADEVQKVKVWPAEGVLIRDEVTGQPITPGQLVPLTRSVARALGTGDLLREAPGQDRQTGKDTRAAAAEPQQRLTDPKKER
jgi:hypothetical protein